MGSKGSATLEERALDVMRETAPGSAAFLEYWRSIPSAPKRRQRKIERSRSQT